MKKERRKILSIIRSEQENFDLYFLVIVGLAVFVLDIFGVVASDTTVAAILAVLTFIAVGMVRNRKVTRDLRITAERLSQHVNDLNRTWHVNSFFGHGIYYALADRFKEAKSEIWLLGRIGYNTLNNSIVVI